MSQPARKKRKLNLDDDSDSDCSSMDSNTLQSRQLLAEELDLEIALRERLAETLECRLTWAVILQDALLDDITTESMPGTFEDAAIEATEVIETPCNVLFAHDSSPPQIISDLLEHASRASVPNEPNPQPKPRARKSRPSRVPTRPHGAKLLFIRDTTVTPPAVAKLVCPDCGRSEFTNLQGLLNHTRLRHKRDYGSHDECMQRCAVIVGGGDEGEADWVVQNGIELAGVSLPSLRRLFEIAVGNDRGIVDGLTGGQEENDEDAEVISSTYLSKTLGHHKDTPALAPFLGRTPKRRCINVYNEDAEVDVDNSGLVMDPTVSWRMSFPHRNEARSELDMVVETMPAAEPRTEIQPSIPNNTSGTRFHIIARVVVSDRSVWIPPDRRSQALPDHTHRWSIVVDSPSYSLHISTFLAKLTVTCITNPPPFTLSTPIIITEPPFVASSTTDKPFLAKVTLTWVGPQNAPMEVEHWVELDPFHTAINPVLGDEQILDVELDRHTELLPIRRMNDPGSRKRKADDPADEDSQASRLAPQIGPGDPYYVAKLKSLLPQYPMTWKDVKGRMSIQHIPYKLVSTSAQFRSLVHGRRKAIEWGRSRALRDAYIASISPASSEEAKAAIHLTTADVFRWLEDEDLFPRPTVDVVNNPLQGGEKKAKMDHVQVTSPEILCLVCGLNHHQYHSPSVLKSVSTDDHVSTCNLVYESTNWHSISMIDVRHPLNFPSRPVNYYPQAPPLTDRSLTTLDPTPKAVTTLTSQQFPLARDLVTTADPELTMAVRTIIQRLKLSNFNPIALGYSAFPLSELGASKSEVERHMAPYALLASLTKNFIKVLVSSGLDTASVDMSMAAAKAKAEGQNTRKTKRPRDHLLTPSHIIRGLAAGSIRHGHIPSSLCLNKLGLSVSGYPSTPK